MKTEYISNREYRRRRQLAFNEMTGAELAAYWDFPNEWHGFAQVEIGGTTIRIDRTKGSVPAIITRAYWPC